MTSDAAAKRNAALKVLRKVAEDESVEVASRIKAAELILKATEPRPSRHPFYGAQAQMSQ